MSGKSGEMARRAAMGIGAARNGGQVAQALQTLRFSVLDKRRGDLVKSRQMAVTKKRDAGHMQAALSLELSRFKRKSGEAKARLEQLGRDPAAIEVSDHAVIRFLERALRMDIDAIRAQIARLIPVDRVDEERTLYIRQGLQFLVHRNRLVTVLDEYMDGYVCEAFSIDDAAIARAPVPAPAASRDAASRAGRALAHRREQKGRAKIETTTARLRAELGR